MNDQHLKLDILLEILDSSPGAANEQAHLSACDACRCRLSRLRILRIQQHRRRTVQRSVDDSKGDVPQADISEEDLSEEDIAAFLDERLTPSEMSRLEARALVDDELFDALVQLRGVLDDVDESDVGFDVEPEQLFAASGPVIGNLLIFLSATNTSLSFAPEGDQGDSFRGRRARIEQTRPASRPRRIQRDTDPAIDFETDRLSIGCQLHPAERTLEIEIVNLLSGQSQQGLAVEFGRGLEVTTDDNGVVHIPVSDLGNSLVIRDLQPVQLGLVVEVD